MTSAGTVDAATMGVRQALSAVQSRMDTISYEASKGDFEAALSAAEAILDPMSAAYGSQAAPTVATLGATSVPSSLALGLAGPSGGTYSTPTGEQVVADAMRYVGVPYKWGGTSPSTGFDCSGFVQHVFADLGITLPRTSEEQAQVGVPVASLAQAQPGDLVFFEPGPGGPGHVGIYVGGGEMIDAPHSGSSVQVQPITTPPVEIRRVLPLDASFGGISAGQLPGSSTEQQLLSMGVPSGLVPLFLESANVQGISPVMLAAVAKAESGFNPNAVSSAGAEGIMQLMPGTAAAHGVTDPFDPTQAVPAAAKILADNLRAFGSVPLALAAYNAGAGAVESYGGIPPYPQTEAYVSRVMAYMSGES